MRMWLVIAFALSSPLLSHAQALEAPGHFAGIADRGARSAALFGEMGKVIQSPRCLNCHPASPSPTQGDDRHAHVPAVRDGAPGLPCTACHTAANTPLVGDSRIGSIPGNPKWALAPPAMAWQGRTLGQICRQLKDPARNGHRSLEALWDHVAHDELVGWGWSPGEGRRPAPGSQAAFGALARAWIDAGAGCPDR